VRWSVRTEIEHDRLAARLEQIGRVELRASFRSVFTGHRLERP